MTELPTAERARARYADALYQSALLRDPDPDRAAQAVIAAFRRIDWATVPLDERTEARLIQCLPPLPRLRLRRPHPLAPLPLHFWKLPPATRLALGLRLLRGMSTELIAEALGQPVGDMRALIVEGIAASSDPPLELSAACHACLAARLDDPAAERGHLLACTDTCPRWEAAAAHLAAQISAAVGDRSLPPAASSALTAVLEREREPAPDGAAITLRLRLGVVVAVLAVLAVLIWPRGSEGLRQAAHTPTAREIVDQARAAFLALPRGSGVLHRQWQIILDEPALTLQADEWVDTQQPARHRMQLLNGKLPEEWQAGDGQAQFRYWSTSAAAFCGPPPNGPIARHAGEMNSWQLGAAEQARMRAARWQSGPWALGLRYLDLAAHAASLHSTGRSGSGPTATLTLAAAGPEINGTLLLNLDPSTFALREVREVWSDNGRTATRTPWQLLASEAIAPETAEEQRLLSAMPPEVIPEGVKRQGPILDPACPLLGAEQTESIPRVMAGIVGVGLIGLPELPAGVERAVLIGANEPSFSPDGLRLPGPPDALQLIYVGPGKRLVFWLPPSLPLSPGRAVPAGRWRVQLDRHAPGLFSAIALPYAPAQGVPSYSNEGGFQVWADGWTRDELMALIAAARPLRLDDWARAPEKFYEPRPLDTATLDLLRRAGRASAPRPGQTHHQVEVASVHQPPFLGALADPYHVPFRARPAARRIETWTEVDPTGAFAPRWCRTVIGPGSVLDASWGADRTRYLYQPNMSSVISDTSDIVQWLQPDQHILQLLQYPSWTLRPLPDGGMFAEMSRPITETNFADLARVQQTGYDLEQEPWLLDVMPTTITLRLQFAPDGRLRESETLGSVTEHGATRSVSLEHTSVQTDEWLDSVPAANFVFTPPPGTVLTDGARAVPPPGSQQPSVTTSLLQTARAVPFPVWSWPDDDDLISFRAARIPPDRLDPRAQGPDYEQLLLRGVAVELGYATPAGNLRMIEGPVGPLRRALQQLPPPWRSSDHRTLSIRGTPHELWIMHGTEPALQWAGVELNGSLFLIEHSGPEAELEAILARLGALQKLGR